MLQRLISWKKTALEFMKLVLDSFCSVLFRSVPFRSVPFRSVPFRCVPFRSVSFRFVSFRFVSDDRIVKSTSL